MLDHTMGRAAAAGVTNVEPRQGDARELPYPDSFFDAAYLVAVLGEIPDADAALRELARVLRPGSRLVVGERFGDPHMVTERSLRRRARRSGLDYERRVGRPIGYFRGSRHAAAEQHAYAARVSAGFPKVERYERLRTGYGSLELLELRG